MKSGIDKTAYRSLFDEVLLFKVLSTEGRDFLFTKAEGLLFEPGEIIVKAGDFSPSFFVVMDGSVIVSLDQEGNDIYINTLGTGAVIGEAAMFLKAPRTADVRAADPTVVLKITRFDVMEFLRDKPREGNKALLAIIFGLLQKLRDSNQELAYERRSDSQQADVDALVAELTGT